MSRHSRIGAGILTGQAGLIYGGIVVRDHSVFAFLLLIGFGYWYVSSVVGTVRYHRLQREHPVHAEIASRPPTAAGGQLVHAADKRLGARLPVNAPVWCGAKELRIVHDERVACS